MSAGSVSAGEAFVTIGADLGPLQKGLRQAAAGLDAFAQRAQSTAFSLLKFGGAITAPFTDAALAASEFSDVLGKIGTVVDNKDLLPDIEGRLKAVSQETGKTISDLGAAFFDLVSAGVPVEQALAQIGDTAKFATGGFASVKDATSASLTVLDQFGDELNGLGDAGDFLSKVAKRGRTDVGQLAGQVGRVASRAKGAGLSVNEFGGAFAALTRATGGTELATTALGGIITTFSNASDEGKKLAKEKFGLELSAASLKSEGFVGALAKLRTATTDELTTIFSSQEAQIGIIPLLQQFEKLQEDVASVQDRTGESSRNFAERQKQLGFQLEKTGAVLNNLRTTIGQALEGPLKAVLAVIQSVVPKITAFIEKNKGLVIAIGAVGAAAVAAGGILFGIAAAASAASFVIGGLATAASAAGAVLGVVGTVLAALFSPIGLIIAGIAALVVAFVDFGSVTSSVIGFFKEEFGGLVELVGATVGAIVSALTRGDIEAAGEVLFAALNLIWLEGVTALKSVWTDFTNGLADTYASIESGWTDLVFDLASVWVDFTSALESTWEGAVNYLAEKWIDLQGLFDSGLDTEGAKQALRDQADSKAKEIENQRKAVQQALAEERQAELNAISSAREAERQKDQQALEAARAKLFGARLELGVAIAEANGEDLAKGLSDEAKLDAEIAEDGKVTIPPDALGKLKTSVAEGVKTGQLTFRGGEDETGDLVGAFGSANFNEILGASLFGDDIASKQLEEQRKQTELQEQLVDKPVGFA